MRPSAAGLVALALLLVGCPPGPVAAPASSPPPRAPGAAPAAPSAPGLPETFLRPPVRRARPLPLTRAGVAHLDVGFVGPNDRSIGGVAADGCTRSRTLERCYGRLPALSQLGMQTLEVGGDRTVMARCRVLDAPVTLLAVKGPSQYAATRKMVASARALLFVVDPATIDDDVLALAELEADLRELGDEPAAMPLAFVWLLADEHGRPALEAALNPGGRASFMADPASGQGLDEALEAVVRQALEAADRR